MACNSWLIRKGKIPFKKRGKPSYSDEKNNSSQAKRLRLYKRRVFSLSNQLRLKNRGAHFPEFDERGGRCALRASKKLNKTLLFSRFIYLLSTKNYFYEYHNI